MKTDALAGSVGYQIRHDQTTCDSKTTRIKFMTDGILLAEVKQDFLLRNYSAIVMDEVHERGLNSDLLLGLLSRIVPVRPFCVLFFWYIFEEEFLIPFPYFFLSEVECFSCARRVFFCTIAGSTLIHCHCCSCAKHFNTGGYTFKYTEYKAFGQVVSEIKQIHTRTHRHFVIL
jgi:hypothetical protein